MNDTEQSGLASQQRPEGFEEATIVNVRAPNMINVYVNAASLAVGQFDIRLFVGNTTPSVDGKTAISTHQVCLIMSPEYAKVVADSLFNGVKDFEGTFGGLRQVQMHRPEPRPPHTEGV